MSVHSVPLSYAVGGMFILSVVSQSVILFGISVLTLVILVKEKT